MSLSRFSGKDFESKFSTKTRTWKAGRDGSGILHKLGLIKALTANHTFNYVFMNVRKMWCGIMTGKMGPAIAEGLMRLLPPYYVNLNRIEKPRG